MTLHDKISLQRMDPITQTIEENQRGWTFVLVTISIKHGQGFRMAPILQVYHMW